MTRDPLKRAAEHRNLIDFKLNKIFVSINLLVSTILALPEDREGLGQRRTHGVGRSGTGSVSAKGGAGGTTTDGVPPSDDVEESSEEFSEEEPPDKPWVS